MIARAIRALYSAAMWLGQPLLRLKLARRGRLEPGYAQAVEERFGHYVQSPGRGSIWLHAVSLGEARAAVPLVKQLRARMPHLRLLVTNGTATGRAETARLLLREGDIQVWQPWDTPGAVDRFLQHFKPCIGILMETEMWPNLCAGCAFSGTPLVLANARLSARSQRRTKRLAWLAQPAYRSLTAVWAQTQEDAVRLQSVGAAVDDVFGNLKFDLEPDANQLTQSTRWRATVGRPVVMFASSREGEEAMLLDWLQRNRPTAHTASSDDANFLEASAVQWLIVPRHPQRFDEVAQLIQDHGFVVSRRSDWNDSGPKVNPDSSPTIWLGDSLGEMSLYFGLSAVALLGGSFAPFGGQNLIEAAACGCPLVLGPHTFNFERAAELAIAAGAAQRASTIDEAAPAAVRLAVDHSVQSDMATNARTFVHTQRAASSRTAAAIERLVIGAEAGLTRSKTHPN
ncbi:MAG: 3-deoxy-D-manno-octulosonic acid transferase [Burkholderiales bacterium]